MKIMSEKGKGTTVEIVIPAILEAPVEKKGDESRIAESEPIQQEDVGV